MKRQTEMLILGTTFAGLGAASQCKDCLILESLTQAGYEFVSALRCQWGTFPEELSEDGRWLRDEMFRRNIANAEGTVHVPAVTPLLFYYMQKRQFPVLFMTDFVEAVREKEGWLVTIHNVEGTSQIRAKGILDTRAKELSKSKKKIRAIVTCQQEGLELPQSWLPELEFEKGLLKGEVYVSLSVQAQDTLGIARQKLHDVWVSRPEKLQPWKITLMADRFVPIDPAPEYIEKDFIQLDGSGFSNGLEAFEMGAKIGKEWAWV